jgi:hypothetical protein
MRISFKNDFRPEDFGDGEEFYRCRIPVGTRTRIVNTFLHLCDAIGE